MARLGKDFSMHTRTTISIPPELKTVMNAYAEKHPEVNWSRIACDAFRLAMQNGMPSTFEDRLSRIEQEVFR